MQPNPLVLLAETDLGEIIQVFITIAIIIGAFGAPLLKAFNQKKKDEAARRERQQRRQDEAVEEAEEEAAPEPAPAGSENETSPPSMEDVLDEMFGRGWRKSREKPAEEAPREEMPESVRPPAPVRRPVVVPVEEVRVPAPESMTVHEVSVTAASEPSPPMAHVPTEVAARIKPAFELSDMKRAVVMSEILGPPMGLRNERQDWAA